MFLQHVVERLTGERLAELGHRLVFEPLPTWAMGLELMDELARRITGRDHPLFDFYMLHPTD